MVSGTVLVKYSFFIINLIFVLAGIALIAVGVVFYFRDPDEVEVTLDVIGSVPVLGSIMFLTAFLGCRGAIRESICMLSTYGVIMLVLFLIQVVVGTCAVITYNNKDTLKENISNNFKDEIKNWDENTNVDVGIGAIQQNFKCCGAINAYDWEGKIPKSCCKDLKNCGEPPKSDQIFHNGCANKIFEVVENVVPVIVIVVFTIAPFELAAAMLAFYLSNCIRNNIRRGDY